MPKKEKIESASGERRLVLCFDGTWNTPEDETNVSRIYAAIADMHSGCKEQMKFYDEGVGTTWGSRLSGGVLGTGLENNILEGYCWLINNYSATPEGTSPIVETFVDEHGAIVRDGKGKPKDDKYENGAKIFLFGFSRGAYTARSLAGLISVCGVIRRSKDDEQVKIDSSHVQEAWTLYRGRTESPGEGADRRDSRYKKKFMDFRKKHAYDVKVHFIGVWDTVGALGVPRFGGALFPEKFKFHDTGLGRVVEYAYHAMAIDEHRRDYDVTLWTKCDPAATKDVKQYWFPGAHANVGGGYEDDLLPELSLRWIAERACERSLRFVQPPEPLQDDSAKTRKQDPANGQSGKEECEKELWDFQIDGTELMAPVQDSYAGFGLGLYKVGSIFGVMWRRFFGSKKGDETKVEGESDVDGRYYRRMLVNGVNEFIHRSAQDKWARDSRYRPRNLARAGREAGTAARQTCPGNQLGASGE